MRHLPVSADSLYKAGFCKVTLPTTGADFTMPTLSNPAALVSCSSSGRLQAYFEDVDQFTGLGFDEHTTYTTCNGTQQIGLTRRNTVCAVLSYLESILNIDPSVTATNPLIIKFGVSYSTTFPLTPFGPVDAIVTPNLPIGVPGYHHTYLATGIISGGTNLGSQHCGNILINFNNSYNYCNATIGGCEEDFYSIILHEITHLLGFCSGVERIQNGSTNAINLPLGANTFTKFDSLFLYDEISGSLTKIVTGTSLPSLNVPASTLLASIHNCWLTSDPLGTSRTNQPIVDYNDLGTGNLNYSYSHFEEMFARANYRSPGFTPAYVMGWRKKPGLMRRIYSNQELRVLKQLGFSFVSGYPLSNRPPCILTPIISPSLVAPGINNHLTQTPPAGNSDLYITTTSCRQVKIDLNANGTGSITDWVPATASAVSSHSLGLTDPDGDQISVFDNGAGTPHGIWIIEGCMPDAANPAPVTLSANRDVITFTPRNDFVGRTRFGFHVFDGTERGSLLVITIDVTKDRNCYNNTCDLVVNGNFEAGSEYNSYSSSSGYNMITIADNVNFWDHYMEFGGEPNQVLTDGVEQLVPGGNSNFGVTTIVDTYTPAHCFGPEASYYTISPFGLHFIPNSFPSPSTVVTPNKRYLLTEYNTGIHNEQNITLHDYMVPGGQYKIEFDYYMLNWGATSLNAAPFFTSEPLSLFFNGTHYLGNITYPVTAPEYISVGPFSWSGTGWQHYSANFSYPYSGGLTDNYMRIIYDYASSPLCSYMLLDNVSLKREFCATLTASSTTLPSTLTATVPGGNVTYQWFLNGTSIPGATSATYLATSYGTYSVVATDANGCTSASCPPPTITMVDPCPAFTNSVGASNIMGTIDGSAGPLTVPPVPGKAYYVTGTVTVPTSLSFSGGNFLMAPKAKIYVDNGASLTITGSHLATCPGSSDIWQGIELASQSASITVNGGSLIEDADKAIYVHNRTDAGTGLIVQTDDAIFNRNHWAIYIDNDMYNPSKYRFVNTVFTSRELYPHSVFTPWPSTATLKSSSPGLYPPFAITGYHVADCKDRMMSLAGIYLNSVGNTNVFGSAYTYKDITAGDETNPVLFRNFFDYMRAGIEAHNSNLAVRNSTFLSLRQQKIPGTTAGGSDGVYADATSANLRHLSIENGTNPSTIARNEFWDNANGVEAINLFDTRVNTSYFTSSNKAGGGIAPWIGWQAINLQSNNFGRLIADGNTVENMLYGIVAFSNAPLSATVAGGRQIDVSNNSVSLPNSAVSLGISPIYNNNTGIWVANMLNCSSCSPSSSANAVTVNNNAVSGCYNGLLLSGWRYMTVTASGNNPIALQQASSSAPANGAQYGIRILNSDKAYIIYNNISEQGNPPVFSTNPLARAVYAAANTYLTVGCNSENNIGRGYEFYDNQFATVWRNNTMLNNQMGYVLGPAFGGADISVQGLPGGPPVPAWGTSYGNVWNGSWPAGASQTYSYSQWPWWSSLAVRNMSGETPSSNNFASLNYPYSFSAPSGAPAWTHPQPSLYTVSSVLPYNCTSAVATPYLRMAYEQVAMDSLMSDTLPDRNTWLSQLAAYRAALADTALYNSSPILQAFTALCAGSRYDWINGIEDSLATGNIAIAAALLTAGAPPQAPYLPGALGTVLRDGSAGDEVVNYYSSFFRIYLAWQAADSLNEADSMELAGIAALCPALYGPEVYQARQLLGAVTGAWYTVYDDDCFGASGGMGGEQRRAQIRAGKQDYKLFPNPAAHAVTIAQLIPTERPVSITLLDPLGREVYADNTEFINNATLLPLPSIASGLYYIQIKDEQNGVFILKLIIE